MIRALALAILCACTMTPSLAQVGDAGARRPAAPAQDDRAKPALLDEAKEPVLPPPAPAAQTDIGGQPKLVARSGPPAQCVKSNEFGIELRSGIRPAGEAIVFATNFMPTNQRVDVGVRSSITDGTRYFAGIDYGDGDTYLLKRQDVATRRAVESDILVKKGLLDVDQTIVTLNMGDDLAWFWKRVDLYLYTCPDANKSPARVSLASIRLSPYWLGLVATVITIVSLYAWIAFVFRSKVGFFLNPTRVVAGPDGKASLATFQTLSFSLVVVGLIMFYMLQTGVLLNLSGTVLALLGISGVGTTIAKGADAKRNAISAQNRAWLLRRNWISAAKPAADPSHASWSDFFSTDGVFDVYRYQSFIFSLMVIGSLIAAGATELSSFMIPETILGILGLSQMVYIGGKLVTQTNMSDLNAAIDDLRDREKKLKTGTVGKQGLAPSPQDTASGAQSAVDAYKEKARDVAALFTEATGIPVSDAALEPSIS